MTNEVGASTASAGVLPNSRIRTVDTRVSSDIIAALKLIEDLSSTVSDILDEMGIQSTLCASRIKPTIPTARIVGTAITVRNTPQRMTSDASLASKSWEMAEVEGINQARPGDVLVIEGLADISNMGGIMASLALRQGLQGAIVDGGVRDVGHSRRIGFPIWSKDVSPITGKWRCVTEEVNVPVKVAGVTVHAGDLVVADETGICFVPKLLISEVATRVEALAKKEEVFLGYIDAGMTLTDFVAKLYPRK